jgi:hypothetical protein
LAVFKRSAFAYDGLNRSPTARSALLPRREALWALKGLRDEPLPLFAAASEKENSHVAEVSEPEVQLRQMTAGPK